MQLIRGVYNIRPNQRGCVATIGNFDGIHLGHVALLNELKKAGKRLQLSTLVMTFEPQPNEYFQAENVPPRLHRLRDKLRFCKQFGIDRLLSLRFDEALANLSAEDFIQQVLIDGLDVKYIIIGDDFRFGAKRAGDFALLKSFGDRIGFEVLAMDTHNIDGERVSSTRVRKALGRGDLATAEKLLGRHYGMSGRVAHGNKRGRIIGFPTANIFMHRRAVPILGVYAVTVHGLEEKPIYGVANVGNRPTVDGTRSLLEVHLFDFDRDIYGKHIYVEFHLKIRDEKKFASFELLKQQIFKDAENAKAFFATVHQSGIRENP